MIRSVFLTLPLFLAQAGLLSAAVASFDSFGLAADSFDNNAEGDAFTTADGIAFENSFTDFGGGITVWEGFALSTTSETATNDFSNQYSAFPGGGSEVLQAAPGDPYAVAYASSDPASIQLPSGLGSPLSIDIANTTWAALSIRDGSAFSDPFGTGGEADWFELTLSGFDAVDALTGEVSFRLADFPADGGGGFILEDWTTLDLSPLGNGVSRIDLGLETTDVGDFGPNTPMYVAIDNLVVVPEPARFALYIGLLFLIPCARRLRR